MRIFYYVRLLTVVVAASYMTLIVFSSSEARRLIIPYGMLIFALTLINLWGERNAYKS
jgi:hypothetical protein